MTSKLGPHPIPTFDELCLGLGRWQWCGDDQPHFVHPVGDRESCPGVADNGEVKAPSRRLAAS